MVVDMIVVREEVSMDSTRLTIVVVQVKVSKRWFVQKRRLRRFA